MSLNILEISKISLFWTFRKKNWLTLASWACFTLTLFRTCGKPPTSFSLVTSTNVRISHKIVWLLVSTPLPHLCKFSRPCLVQVSNYWTWTRSISQKNRSFWSNPYKIMVMITSLIVMLELPNFGHMTTFTIWFQSRDNSLLVASWTEILTSQPLHQNAFILRRSTVANFADILKIPTIIKKAFLRLKKS